MSLRIPAMTSIVPFPFLPIWFDLHPTTHGLGWLSLMRILETPLGSANRLILNPVSLTLSLPSEETLFLDPIDDAELLTVELRLYPSLKIILMLNNSL